MALTLLQNGISVRVIDRISQFQVGQRGGALSVSIYILINILHGIDFTSAANLRTLQASGLFGRRPESRAYPPHSGSV